ncbi:MAG: hypothetical protein JWP81_3192 [Ferruginibacter sp.]|nr:hypothetical protein [Ferruginibacter sp.]
MSIILCQNLCLVLFYHFKVYFLTFNKLYDTTSNFLSLPFFFIQRKNIYGDNLSHSSNYHYRLDTRSHMGCRIIK